MMTGMPNNPLLMRRSLKSTAKSHLNIHGITDYNIDCFEYTEKPLANSNKYEILTAGDCYIHVVISPDYSKPTHKVDGQRSLPDARA